MTEKYTSIAHLNIGKINPQIIVGNTLTAVEFDTNNDIDKFDVPIPIDTRYFNVVLPATDVQIEVPSKIRITGIVSVTGLPGTGFNQYQLQLYRDVHDGAGFKLIRELIPIDSVSSSRGAGCMPYSYTLDVDFNYGVDPGHLFRLICARNSGSGDADLISRGSTLQIEILKLL